MEQQQLRLAAFTISKIAVWKRKGYRLLHTFECLNLRPVVIDFGKRAFNSPIATFLGFTNRKILSFQVWHLV